jgi:hypothetical protein
MSTSITTSQPLPPSPRYPALEAYLAKPEGPVHPDVAEQVGEEQAQRA